MIEFGPHQLQEKPKLRENESQSHKPQPRANPRQERSLGSEEYTRVIHTSPPSLLCRAVEFAYNPIAKNRHNRGIFFSRRRREFAPLQFRDQQNAGSSSAKCLS
jgi:hypothetical protein